MSKHYRIPFNTRQYMQTKDYEIFFYEDKVLSPVDTHRHDFYEIYFFLGGNVDINLNGEKYPLAYGNICLIPPATSHKPTFRDNDLPYRRIVLWISPAYMKKLEQSYGDILRCFSESAAKKQYHYAPDFGSAQLLFSKLIAILEESHGTDIFHQHIMSCLISSFLLSLNRTIYNLTHSPMVNDQSTLFSGICDYIGTHLEEDLTLDALAARFHVSKYYISHLFKESIGLSTHQYILKKRLHASKNALLSGIAIQEASRSYGFRDYTTFFRAFKKEFGMSPREFKDISSLSPTSHNF